MTARKPANSVEAAVRAAAKEAIEIPEYDEVKQTDGWQSLLKALAAELPDQTRKHMRTLDEICEMQEEINSFLTEDQRHQFWLYNEAQALDSEIHQDAMYRLAFEMGRRLGGAR